MNPPASSKTPTPRLSDADLDAALHPDQDAILPSSGFADSVMTAIHREAAAPAPIPFPWLRALPGLAAAVVVLLGLFTVMVFLLRSSVAAAPSSSVSPQALFAYLPHSPAGSLPNAFWLAISLVVVFACLLWCRRLIRAR